MLLLRQPDHAAEPLRGYAEAGLHHPLQETKEEAVAALKEFYKGRTLLPNSFTANNRVEDIQAMYVPFWLFDSKVSASGSYQGASDSVYETDDEVITTTVVYNCEREGTMSFDRIPVDGSEKMDDTFMESIEPFDYSEMVPFSTAYLTGFWQINMMWMPRLL